MSLVLHRVTRLGVGSLVMLVSACTSPDCTQGDPPDVVATVVDATTGQPITTGVTGAISAGSRQIPFETFSAGTYTVMSAEPGLYVASLAASGYQPWDSVILVRRPQECRSGTVNFSVRLTQQ